MIRKQAYPILEFDDDPTAKINPDTFVKDRFSSDTLVITFFREVIEKLLSEQKIVLERIIEGESPLSVYAFADDPSVLITQGEVGCPACGSDLDLFQGMGIRKVMFCGGGGVLDSRIAVSQLLLVDGAIRDEGFSYHYLPPSRIAYTDKAVTDRVAAYLDTHGIPYLRGLTWTTDAIFRETDAKIAERRKEGAWIVEMEQAGCIAVAQVRHFAYAALIYGGDDVSQATWNQREWRSCNGFRYDLVMLCKRLVREL